MRRIIVAIGTTLTGLVLLFSYSTSLNRTAFSGALGAGGHGPRAPGSAAPAVGAGAAAPPGAGAGTTYDGSVASTPYGPVQVRITVAGGKLTAAQPLQLPSGNAYDEQVNTYAVPMLNQEAVDAQSAKIALISGATYTSTGYAQSLQSALDQAKL